MFSEIGAILMAIIMYVFKNEIGGVSGPEKRKQVVDKILKEITDEGGIHITNKWVLKAVDHLVPAIVDYVVRQMNKFGFFDKSN